MKKNIMTLIIVFFLSASFSTGQTQKAEPNRNKGQTNTSVQSDSVNTRLLLSHLRAHFDDLHDVIMRYHHQDPAIRGLITLEMLWRDKKLVSCTVNSNGTGNDSLASGLIDKMKAWEIDGLDGPYQTVLPLRVRIVGSEQPDFPELAILTGFAGDKSGKPLQNAMVILRSLLYPEVRVPNARTNSEGIFIRTLIPPGEYQLSCVPAGGDTIQIGARTFRKGEHKKEHLVIGTKLLKNPSGK